MNIVLVEPQIPWNTGAIARLCAGTGTPLHLCGKLGFSLDDRYLKRAGLDYWPSVDLRIHASFESLRSEVPRARFLFFSVRGARSYASIAFCDDDHLVFGKETEGLSRELLAREADNTFRIPISAKIRSHNLANAASIVLYEGLRQLGFPGLLEAPSPAGSTDAGGFLTSDGEDPYPGP